MALIKYDRATTPSAPRGKAMVNFGKQGVISLNLLAAQRLDVSGGG